MQVQERLTIKFVLEPIKTVKIKISTILIAKFPVGI